MPIRLPQVHLVPQGRGITEPTTGRAFGTPLGPPYTLQMAGKAPSPLSYFVNYWKTSSKLNVVYWAYGAFKIFFPRSSFARERDILFG